MDDRLLSISERAGGPLLRLLGSTWRCRRVLPASGRASGVSGPVLYALWHGHQLPLTWVHRDRGATVLVSMNRDGQHAVNVISSMGYRTVRGSTSRGGAAAVRGMVEALGEGADCAITPDGPRGPAGEVGPGAEAVSALSGVPVIPSAAAAAPALRLSSWDRFMVPLPFAGVVAAYSPALPPPAGGDATEWSARLARAIDRSAAVAELLASPSAGAVRALLGALALVLGPAARAALMARPRRESGERRGFVPAVEDRPVWLHGASLGELKGLMPLLAVLRERRLPHWVTCTTPAGREFLSRERVRGSFAPLDLPGTVERFMERVRPRILVLAETELWPVTLTTAIRRGVPCMMVNARLSPSSLRGYRPLRPLLSRSLACMVGILARSGEDAERLAALGAPERLLQVTGDSKSLADPGDPPPGWRRLLPSGGRVVVAGSTRRGEEREVARAAIAAGLVPVIAPRHLERIPRVERELASLGIECAMWSDLEGGEPADGADCVLVDTHGLLARMYGIGDVAFVGGTLTGHGGHNVLEPMQRGVPVVVGPDHGSFREVVAEAACGGLAAVAEGRSSLEEALRRLAAPGGTPPGAADSLRGLAARHAGGAAAAFGRLVDEALPGDRPAGGGGA